MLVHALPHVGTPFTLPSKFSLKATSFLQPACRSHPFFWVSVRGHNSSLKLTSDHPSCELGLREGISISSPGNWRDSVVAQDHRVNTQQSIPGPLTMHEDEEDVLRDTGEAWVLHIYKPMIPKQLLPSPSVCARAHVHVRVFYSN